MIFTISTSFERELYGNNIMEYVTQNVVYYVKNDLHLAHDASAH